MAFLGTLVHLLYHQYVRNAVLDVCAKSVPVCMGQKWGNERAITERKIILTCPFPLSDF